MLRATVRCLCESGSNTVQAISGCGAQRGRVVPAESTMCSDGPHGCCAPVGSTSNESTPGDEQVGPQRSKVRALLNPPFQTRMRRVERPESASKQAPAARDRNPSWHSRSRRVGRPRSFKLRDSPGQPSWGPADDLVLCCAYHLNLINNRKK